MKEHEKPLVFHPNPPKMSGIRHANCRAVRIRELFDKDASAWSVCKTSSMAPVVRFELVESGMELTKEDLESCINMVEATSGKDYRASSIGWHRSAKMEEMMDLEMIYLLLREDPKPSVTQQYTPNPVSPPCAQSSRILGFLSFMLTNDDPPHQDREVVYIYEIHLDESLRRRGLGSALIRFAENAAHCCGITKTMLTVFSANAGARALYERLGYGKDACSPRDKVMRRKVVKADYMIMSKELGGFVA